MGERVDCERGLNTRSHLAFANAAHREHPAAQRAQARAHNLACWGTHGAVSMSAGACMMQALPGVCC